MWAIFLTWDGLGGHFLPSTNGDPLVAVSDWGKRELLEELQWQYNGQLVELPRSWPHSVTTVESVRGHYRCPPDLVA